MDNEQKKILRSQIKYSYNLQILFFQYLSYHSRPARMIGIKRIIQKKYFVTDDLFDWFLWRANRVLFFQKEHNFMKYFNNDKTTQSVTYNNLIRQKGYFKIEVQDYYKDNNILFDKVFEPKGKLTGCNEGVEDAIDVAINPHKEPDLENRFFNGDTYFIDGI